MGCLAYRGHRVKVAPAGLGVIPESYFAPSLDDHDPTSFRNFATCPLHFVPPQVRPFKMPKYEYPFSLPENAMLTSHYSSVGFRLPRRDKLTMRQATTAMSTSLTTP